MIGFGQESFRSGSSFSSRSACSRRKMGLERLVSRISNAAFKVFFLRLRRVSLGCKTLLAIGAAETASNSLTIRVIRITRTKGQNADQEGFALP
ncbi:hypothetical protein NKH57_32170 [Mesorhizobium sp. M1050]|uniref:hypothetical protein n=1 Tax=Mesorhizobium sp. M1050 TaxID=2957051 RepID=UPI0033390940